MSMSAAIMQLVALNQGSGIQQGALVHHPQTSQQSAPKSKSEAARRKKQASINAKQAKVDKLARQASLDAQEQQPPGSLQFSARGSLPITTGSHHQQPGGSRLPLQPLSNSTQLPSSASAAGQAVEPMATPQDGWPGKFAQLSGQQPAGRMFIHVFPQGVLLVLYLGLTEGFQDRKT